MPSGTEAETKVAPETLAGVNSEEGKHMIRKTAKILAFPSRGEKRNTGTIYFSHLF
jgi:hypothetical protein